MLQGTRRTVVLFRPSSPNSAESFDFEADANGTIVYMNYCRTDLPNAIAEYEKMKNGDTLQGLD
jgi:hypothetical protein